MRALFKPSQQSYEVASAISLSLQIRKLRLSFLSCKRDVKRLELLTSGQGRMAAQAVGPTASKDPR